MKFLREPLLHFMALGGALFLAFALFGRWSAEQPNRLVVSTGMLENLRVSFERNTGRAPTDAELDVAIEEYIREDVLTREAIALGMHLDDPIVRRQLRQRVEFLQNDNANAVPPTEAELQALLDLNPAPFLKRGAEGVPVLTEVRPAVERAWFAAKRKETLDAAYAQLRARYEVVIEKPAAAEEGNSSGAP